MTDLDAKALERATQAAHLGPITADQSPIEFVIRAYLTAINYDAQRAVVEAARKLHRVRNGIGEAMFADGDEPIKSAVAANLVVTARLLAAVAALEGRTDGR